MRKNFDLLVAQKKPQKISSVLLFLKRNWLVFLPLFVVFVFFIIYFNQAKTETAFFYPESCLGGWQNPQLAQGRSEISDSGFYNDSNSAVLFNSLAEIYCGSFMGEIPEGSSPEKAILRLGLFVKPHEFTASSTEELDPEALNQGTTTEILISSSQEPEISTTVSMSPSPSESAPALVEPSSEEPPVSFWHNLFNVAFAEELSQDPSSSLSPLLSFEPEPAPTLESFLTLTPEPLPEIIFESTTAPEITPNVSLAPDSETVTSSTGPLFSPEGSLILSSGLPVSLEPATSSFDTSWLSSQPEVADELISSPLPVYFLEVFYSFDGADWLSLGKVDLFSIENISFEIPDFDWGKLSLLQVKIMPLPNELSDSEILLEHVGLEVFYGIEEQITPETSFLVSSSSEFFLSTSSEPLASEISGNNLLVDQAGNLAIMSPDFSETPSAFLASEPSLSVAPVILYFPKGRFLSQIQDSKIDYQTNHECSVEPFSIKITSGNSGSVLLKTKLSKNSLAGTLFVGDLPFGVKLVFMSGKESFFDLPKNTKAIDVLVNTTSDSQKGSFNIPIIFEEKDGQKTSTTACQLNLIIE